MKAFLFAQFIFTVECVSGLVSPPPQHRFHTARRSVNHAPDDLQSELDAHGLGLCHGVLHASGIRCLADLKSLTSTQLESMRFLEGADRRSIQSFISTDAAQIDVVAAPTTTTNKVSTSVEGAFDRPPRGRFEAEPELDFNYQVIDNDIFRGQLFTVEQCEQINRMAEYHSYRGIGTPGAGWTHEIYTLTAQHLQCKEIPGFIPTTKPVFDQLIRSLYNLFPGRIKPGTIMYESDGEPHLVKYNGKAKGTALHTDNSEYVYITINVMLSEPTDFAGGGTYITKIDQTIKLNQGEMLIHLGDLEHAGVEIEGGVRRLLIGFFACEWEDAMLNIEKVDQARCETWQAAQDGTL